MRPLGFDASVEAALALGLGTAFTYTYADGRPHAVFLSVPDPGRPGLGAVAGIRAGGGPAEAPWARDEWQPDAPLAIGLLPSDAQALALERGPAERESKAKRLATPAGRYAAWLLRSRRRPR
jgi:hypothetical protein